MIARLKLWASLVGVAVVALVASWFGGRKSAATDIKAKETEQRLEAVKEAQDVRDEVEALDRDELRRRTLVWVRDGKR